MEDIQKKTSQNQEQLKETTFVPGDEPISISEEMNDSISLLTPQNENDMKNEDGNQCPDIFDDMENSMKIENIFLSL